MEKSPCYKCTIRTAECHATCIAYTDWQQRVWVEKEHINKHREKMHAADADLFARMTHKQRKRKHGQK